MSFYKMERGWLDSDMFADAVYDERSAWSWMIAEARWEDGYTAVHGSPMPVKRGQFYASVRFMAEKFQWSTNRVLRFLEKLKKWGSIVSTTETGQTLITICNYSKYQARGDSTGDTNGNTGGDTIGDSTGDKLEEIQEIQELKNISAKRKSTQISKPEDVPEVIWNDFVTMRKKKNSPITETALAGIRKEADKAGWDLQRALEECCARGWQGFKADWVTNNINTLKEKQNAAQPHRGTKSDRARAALFADFIPEPAGEGAAS